jgi:expansin
MTSRGLCTGFLVGAVLVAGCGSGSGEAKSDGSGGTSGGSGSSPASAGGVTSSSGAADGSGGSSSSGGVSSVGGSPSSGGASAVSCTTEPTHTGQATFYTTADGTGNCSFDASPNDLMIGAMNATDYAGSAVCGGCAQIKGPNGEITIRIVDQCPECPQGNIDLSPEAFDGIAERSQGRVPITWTYVECDVTGPISYRFKEGSSQYWTAVQVRNHDYRVAKFEYQKNGAFIAVPRETYNYFVEASGMGPGPYTFRVTDVYGASIVDTGIALEVAEVVPGKSQFPTCSP